MSQHANRRPRGASKSTGGQFASKREPAPTHGSDPTLDYRKPPARKVVRHHEKDADKYTWKQTCVHCGDYTSYWVEVEIVVRGLNCPDTTQREMRCKSCDSTRYPN